jgi:hypothetical protein
LQIAGRNNEKTGLLGLSMKNEYMTEKTSSRIQPFIRGIAGTGICLLMHMNRILIIIILPGYMIASCVERYYPDIESDSSSRIIVEALINDQDSIQQVKLSKTASLENPGILPLTGCLVTVNDIGNNEFRFQELSGQPGVYKGIIDESALQTGNKFRLHFSTPAGKEYESGYEELLPCPPVDSVYYEIESVLTTDPDVDLDGAQFYVDFKAPENYGRYYRWQIDETWEYHSTWKIRMYYAGEIYHVFMDSLFCCYKTQPVDDIFILSTNGLVENSYRKYRLHFVDDHTQKLMHKYSLLIKQYSISEKAYYYWSGLNKNNQESGGLFDRQPELVKSNVINSGNSGEVVLGYFSVSSVKTKRIIISDIRGLSFRDVPWCEAGPLPEYFLRYSCPEEWPIYLVMLWDPLKEEGVLGTAPQECFDCRLLGGITKKPDYWD